MDKYNIKYHKVVTQPGDLLFIEGGVYHIGGCLTSPCVNIAANVAGPSWVKDAFNSKVAAEEPSSTDWYEVQKCRCSDHCKELLKFRLSKEFYRKLNK